MRKDFSALALAGLTGCASDTAQIERWRRTKGTGRCEKIDFDDLPMLIPTEIGDSHLTVVI